VLTASLDSGCATLARSYCLAAPSGQSIMTTFSAKMQDTHSLPFRALQHTPCSLSAKQKRDWRQGIG